MTNKMISNSDILSGLFNKKQFSFLQEIDKKLDIIEDYKNKLKQKKSEVKELLEDYKIENVKKENVFKFIEDLKDRVKDLGTRIKELNQAIIRLVVDKEVEYKYQTQDVKQIVCFIKDKIKEYIELEEKLNEELAEFDNKILDIIEGVDISKEKKNTKTIIEELVNENEEIKNISKDEKNTEVPRRIRQGSALNEIKALEEIKNKSKEKKVEIIKPEEMKHSIENGVLLISEKVGKIFLPYKKEDIEGYLLSYPKEYKNYDDVIEKEYIIPLDEFMKNQTLSRFREMYDLIRNKELKSMVEAMKISTKFMFRYELNPAIIAACNSKKELDKYLDCLEKNKLEEFDIFDIKFELNLL